MSTQAIYRWNLEGKNFKKKRHGNQDSSIHNGHRTELSKDPMTAHKNLIEVVFQRARDQHWVRNEQTEIVSDLKRGGRRPSQDVRIEIPTGRSTNGMVGRIDAAKENCRNQHNDYHPHCPARSRCLHFSSNSYIHRRSTDAKLERKHWNWRKYQDGLNN